jgi:hypothetical protein
MSIDCTYTADVRSAESPFNPKSKFGGYDKVMVVMVHVRAEDQDGNPISQGYQVMLPIYSFKN